MSYSSKKMKRDKDGNLIPQVYDPIIDDFTPLKPDNLKKIDVQNFPATQDVQLTGSNVKVPVDIQATQTKQLLIVTNDDFSLSQTQSYYGEEGYISTIPPDQTSALDVSNYREIKVIANNDYDVDVMFNIFIVDFWGNIHYVTESSTSTIASGEASILSSVDYPMLNKPISHIALRVTASPSLPTTGSFSFIVEGQ